MALFGQKRVFVRFSNRRVERQQLPRQLTFLPASGLVSGSAIPAIRPVRKSPLLNERVLEKLGPVRMLRVNQRRC